MITWRNGKAGFNGGHNYAIRGVFAYYHSVSGTGPVVTGSGIYWTVELEAFDSTFLEPPTIESADFTYYIMNASGTMVDFGRPDILPINEPVGSVIVKGEYSVGEETAANLATRIKIIIYCKDVTGAEWKEVVFTDRGETWVPNTGENIQTILDIIEGDHTETNVLTIIKKKGTSTVVLQKDIGGSLLPSGITISTTEP